MSAPVVDITALSATLAGIEKQLSGHQTLQKEVAEMRDDLELMKSKELEQMKADVAKILAATSANEDQASAAAKAWESVWENGKEDESAVAKLSREQIYLCGGTIIRGFVKNSFNIAATQNWLAAQPLGKQAALVKSVFKNCIDGASVGSELVFAPLLVSAFVPLLRDDNDLFDLGAMLLPMPTGQLGFPVMVNGAVAQWVPRTGNTVTSNTYEFNRVNLVAKKLRVDACIGDDLLESSELDTQKVIVDDFFGAIREALFLAALEGSGLEDVPLGIVYKPGTTEITINADITADDLIKFITPLKRNKIRFSKENAGWVMDVTIEEKILNLKTSTGAYHFRQEMMAEKTLMGYPYRVCSSLSVYNTGGHDRGKLFFGKWTELYVGLMKRDLRITQSEHANNGTINAWAEDARLYKGNVKVDLDPARPKAFSWAKDIYIS